MIVDDPRNTDDAWMETSAYWYHFGSSSHEFCQKLSEGDDAAFAFWKEIDEDFVHDKYPLYASHKDLVNAMYKAIIGEFKEQFKNLKIMQTLEKKFADRETPEADPTP